MTETKGIWHNGMYIPPELVDEYIQTLEGMPVRLDKSDRIVGHITNVHQVGSGISMDLKRTPEGEEALKAIQRMHQVSVSVRGVDDTEEPV